MIESIWAQITPVRSVRSVKTILVACTYHPPWADQNENILLTQDPFGLVMITGDFNANSTGFLQSEVRRLCSIK